MECGRNKFYLKKKYKILSQKEMLLISEIDNLAEHYSGLFPFKANWNKLSSKDERLLL